MGDDNWRKDPLENTPPVRRTKVDDTQAARETFEAWVRRQGYDWSLRRALGHYQSDVTQAGFLGFSSAAARLNQSTSDDADYTEGVCSDGVAILRDGVRMTISDILETLNASGSIPAAAALLRAAGWTVIEPVCRDCHGRKFYGCPTCNGTGARKSEGG